MYLSFIFSSKLSTIFDGFPWSIWRRFCFTEKLKVFILKIFQVCSSYFCDIPNLERSCWVESDLTLHLSSSVLLIQMQKLRQICVRDWRVDVVSKYQKMFTMPLYKLLFTCYQVHSCTVTGQWLCTSLRAQI